MIFSASNLLVMAASIEVDSPIGDPRRTGSLKVRGHLKKLPTSRFFEDHLSLVMVEV